MARCRHFLPLRVFGPQMKVPQMKDVLSSRDGAAKYSRVRSFSCFAS